MFDLFTKTYELNGDKTNRGNLVAYMNVVYKYRFGGGELSDEEVIDIYSNISESLATQKAKASAANKSKYDKSIDNVDKLLTATKLKSVVSLLKLS